MAKEDIPPSSTRASIEEMIEEDDADINEDDAHEVIELGDLDDLLNGEHGSSSRRVFTNFQNTILLIFAQE